MENNVECQLIMIVKLPNFDNELELYNKGYKMIVGVDEVGCGALAGPVVAGAVVFPKEFKLHGINDSKLLSEKKRDSLAESIKDVAIQWSVGEASHIEICSLGLRQATYLAMQRAVRKIKEADFILVDAWTIPGVHIEQRGIIKGDRTVKSIAAASIIAKVYRDCLMLKYHKNYPKYFFNEHKGYATKKHKAAIEKFGPCDIHRIGYKLFQSKPV